MGLVLFKRSSFIKSLIDWYTSLIDWYTSFPCFIPNKMVLVKNGEQYAMSNQRNKRK